MGIIAALVFGANFYIQQNFTDAGQLTQIAEEVNEQGIQVKAENNEDNMDLDMTESEVQTYLHHMTHQHVEADKKWGGIATSPENIKNLLVIVQANQDAYEYGYYYIEVLKQWEAGDFSNSVDVHNTIWNWHGGTVGRATELKNKQ